ncbi:MAG: hypothetical protein A2015_02350 [Spirochaetes bacterium GWF1_31_7]|nr:MAG: hypothetical protein A2Y30_06200 [Spirochaetes bacterium GWE1_32_154]OHD50756.1 MAG: hypothetical protein A2015_02350 [Spirochaetes bacterium GWF1_31_7]OHD51965.1 MAG: hypothetical protein A2Y29_07195 [Spirochaetes bacterium GWE2_31_10]OHD74506.1 MAG: hypothetical protein A2355_05960 [Spirochaetes bacterium RIFOXYB1_FULL_32_8]HBD95093.1 DUF86 domain-containing protein [Spirochaetia bacterium]
MLNNNVIYILTVLEAIEKISIYSKNFKTPDELYWANDQINFNASVNLLIAIGEETKKIDSNLKFDYQEIHWKAICGLRDKVAHNYRGIDPVIIWSVIKDELPILKIAMVSMIKKLDLNKDLLKEFIDNKYYKHLTYLIEV